MLPVALLASAGKLGSITSMLPSISIGSIRGIGGGAQRDADRQARLIRYQHGVEAGSVTAMQYILGQRDECVNEHERDWYDNAIKWATEKYPDIVRSARALPKLHEPDDDATVSETAIEAEVNHLTATVRNDVANTVSRIGAGATNAATDAIGGNTGTHSFLVPTNWTTLAIVAVVIIGAFLYLKRRG